LISFFKTSIGLVAGVLPSTVIEFSSILLLLLGYVLNLSFFSSSNLAKTESLDILYEVSWARFDASDAMVFSDGVASWDGSSGIAL